jgi:hypothetical protein
MPPKPPAKKPVGNGRPPAMSMDQAFGAAQAGAGVPEGLEPPEMVQCPTDGTVFDAKTNPAQPGAKPPLPMPTGAPLSPLGMSAGGPPPPMGP